MAKVCAMCNKNKVKVQKRVKLRGHYNPTSIRYQKPNLQKVILKGKKVKVCTKCLKKLVRSEVLI